MAGAELEVSKRGEMWRREWAALPNGHKWGRFLEKVPDLGPER